MEYGQQCVMHGLLWRAQMKSFLVNDLASVDCNEKDENNEQLLMNNTVMWDGIKRCD